METETPTIRRALPQDAGQLTALMHASSAYQGEYASILEGYRVTAGYLTRHEVFLAADGDADTVLGFYSLVADPPELDLLFVSDAAQGRGVGRLLVRHMTTRAARLGLPEVRVVSHPPAEPFYRRLGATRAGTVPATPPRIPWDRPELRFTITGAGAARAPRHG